MTNRSLQHLLKLSVVTSAVVLALSARADLRAQHDNGREPKGPQLATNAEAEAFLRETAELIEARPAQRKP